MASARTFELFNFIIQFTEHLNDCSHWTLQTEEFCTCGYSNGELGKAIKELTVIIKGLI